MCLINSQQRYMTPQAAHIKTIPEAASQSTQSHASPGSAVRHGNISHEAKSRPHITLNEQASTLSPATAQEMTGDGQARSATRTAAIFWAKQHG